MITFPVTFIADAHLRGRSDPRQTALVTFLDSLEPAGSELVILGDLFDYMAGPNRAAADAYAPVIQRLRRFRSCHYVEGNHDFDLAPAVLGQAVRIHTGPATLRIGGLRIRVFHGDRVSPSDLGTRLLRLSLQSRPLRFVRDRLFANLIGFRLALGFATLSRKGSWPGRSREYLHARLLALDELGRHGADAAIYAHTHMPLLEPGPAGIIANPGAAMPGGSYLRLADESMCLHSFPDGAILPPGPVPVGKRVR